MQNVPTFYAFHIIVITSHTILNLFNLENKYILSNYNIIIYKA